MARVFDQLYAAARFLQAGVLTQQDWDRILADVDARIATLEGNEARIAAALDALVKLGLDRINEVLVPAFQKVQDLTELGFLTATSTSSVTLTLSAQRIFVIPAGVKRELFTPSEFVAITRVANTTDYAIGRTLAYSAQYGELSVEIVAAFGNAGPFTDWEISATAGSTVAMVAMLAEAKAARDQAVPAAATATGAAGTAVGAAGTATAAAGIATAKAEAAAQSAAAAALFDPATYAPKLSPALTGNPTAPTPAPSDNSLSLATTAFVTAAVPTRGRIVGLAVGNTFGF